MNSRFEEEQDPSQVPNDSTTQTLELTARQRGILQNLTAIGPEIAAYYRDGLRILQYKDIEISASLLAHIAREIDGGLRDILTEHIATDMEFVIQLPESEELRYKRKKKDSIEFTTETAGLIKIEYQEVKGKHEESILQSLGINEPTPFSQKWLQVAENFFKFAHRHGAGRPPRRMEEFEGLWYEFEEVLEVLVGNSLNLLNRLDRILERETPTRDIRRTLPHLLKAESRRSYFFRKLDSVGWLVLLEQDGWFKPDQNPARQEDEDHPGIFYDPIWDALEYVAKIAHHPETKPGILLKIANAIINYKLDEKKIENHNTDLQIVKIIEAIPTAQLEDQHIDFIGVVLKSKNRLGLVDQKISETILPKLIQGDRPALVLQLVKNMVQFETADNNTRTVMGAYWLEQALKKHGQAIAMNRSIALLQFIMDHIQQMANRDMFTFDSIKHVESDLSRLPRPTLAELTVGFASTLFRFADPIGIEPIVRSLLVEQTAIIRRIAFKAITDHYDELKHLFWAWNGNPLDDFKLEAEITELIETHNETFNSDETEQLLQWIESIAP